MPATKTPTWFIIVAVIALLWNLMGLTAFAYDMTRTPADIAAMSPEMQAFYGADIPAWNWIAYGAAVICGVLGCILLLAKRKLAVGLFTISLVGVLVQNYYSLVINDAISSMGGDAYVMPVLVITIAFLLLFFSRSSVSKGWLA